MGKAGKTKRIELQRQRLQLYGLKTNNELKEYLKNNPPSILDPAFQTTTTLKLPEPVEPTPLMNVEVPPPEKLLKMKYPILPPQHVQNKLDKSVETLVKRGTKRKEIEMLMDAGWLPAG